MSLLLRLAHSLRLVLRQVLGQSTVGAQVAVFDAAGRLLLVRHSYGRRDVWMLPGGGVGRREKPVDAAVREVREETGCSIEETELAGIFLSTQGRWRDTIHLFSAMTRDLPVPDGREVVEARFFALDALPATTSEAVLRRLAERAGPQRSAG